MATASRSLLVLSGSSAPLRHAKRQPSVEAQPLTTGPNNTQSNRNAASPPAPPAYTVYPTRPRARHPPRRATRAASSARDAAARTRGARARARLTSSFALDSIAPPPAACDPLPRRARRVVGSSLLGRIDRLVKEREISAVRHGRTAAWGSARRGRGRRPPPPAEAGRGGGGAWPWRGSSGPGSTSSGAASPCSSAGTSTRRSESGPGLCRSFSLIISL